MTGFEVTLLPQILDLLLNLCHLKITFGSLTVPKYHVAPINWALELANLQIMSRSFCRIRSPWTRRRWCTGVFRRGDVSWRIRTMTRRMGLRMGMSYAVVQKYFSPKTMRWNLCEQLRVVALVLVRCGAGYIPRIFTS
jgi:hypothetical protein